MSPSITIIIVKVKTVPLPKGNNGIPSHKMEKRSSITIGCDFLRLRYS